MRLNLNSTMAAPFQTIMPAAQTSSSTRHKLSFMILMSPLLGAGFCSSGGPFEPLPSSEVYCLQTFNSTISGVRLGRYDEQERQFVDTSSNSYVRVGSASTGGQGDSTIHLEYDFAVRSFVDTRVELLVTTSTTDPYSDATGGFGISDTIYIPASSPDCPWTQVSNFYIRYASYDAQVFDQAKQVRTILIARDIEDQEIFRQATPQIYDSKVGLRVH